VRAHGAAAFEQAVAQAVPLSQQLVAAARAGCDLATAEGRARLLAAARPLWSALPEGALKLQILAELARLGQLATDALLDLWRAAPSRPRPQRAAAEETAGAAAPAPATTRGAARNGARRAPRDAPAGPADHALRLLLVNSRWWDRLEPADHELLHGLPPPHGPVFAWLERHLAEHGAQPWTALAAGLESFEGGAAALALVTQHTLADEAAYGDLRHALDDLWIKRLSGELQALASIAATDPAALQRWRAVDADRRRRLRRLRPGTASDAD